MSLHQGGQPAEKGQIDLLITNGKIVGFNDIFHYVNPTQLSISTGITLKRISAISKSPAAIRITEIYRIAAALDITITQLTQLL